MATKPIKIDIGHQEFDCEVGYYIVPGSDSSDDKQEDAPEIVVITSLYVLIEYPHATDKRDIGFLIEDLKEFIIEKVKVK